MSINVFLLSHQAETAWQCACSSRTCFSAKGASLLSILLLSRHSNRPITMVHPTTKVTIVMQKIHPSADMPSLFLAFHFIADYNKSVDKQ